MRKKLYIIFFIFFCLTQLFLISWMIINTEITRKSSVEVYFKCRPYDPYNFMQGRYVMLVFEENRIDISNYPLFNHMNEGERDALKSREIFCIVENVEDEYMISNFTFDRPKNGREYYFSARIKSLYYPYINLAFPFEKYFLQEDMAKKVDVLMRNPDFIKKYNPELKVKVDKRGNSISEELLFGNIPVEEFMKNYEEEK